MNVNLIGCAIVGGFFAVLNYSIRSLSIKQAAAPAMAGGVDDDNEEDI